MRKGSRTRTLGDGDGDAVTVAAAVAAAAAAVAVVVVVVVAPAAIWSNIMVCGASWEMLRSLAEVHSAHQDIIRHNSEGR